MSVVKQLVISAVALCRTCCVAVKEALHNIIKHSGASVASLEFELTGGCLRITIRDDGVGINGHERGVSTGHGIANMKERVKNLGGQIHMETNKGTVIEMKFPLLGG